MNKFNKWHQNQLFWFMEKLNLGVYQVAWISWIKGFIMGALLLLLCGCSVQLQTGYVDPIYGNCCDKDIILEVPDTVEIDTLSFSQFRWKLRTDFNFRWDYAQYAMNQPYNWYSSFSYNVWRPYNSFDVYFNRHNFWYDWTFNYPYYWGYSSWHNPWRNYWYRPYNWGYNWYNGPWHNPGYNVIWNSSRQNNNIAYINGRRGSRNFIVNNNSNIENTINNNRRVRTYPNNNNINTIVNNIRENTNIKPRVYSNPNNNNRVIINNNNNIRVNNNNNLPRNNFNNSNSSSRIYTRPPSTNSTNNVRSSTNINKGGGSSRGGNSNRGN